MAKEYFDIGDIVVNSTSAGFRTSFGRAPYGRLRVVRKALSAVMEFGAPIIYVTTLDGYKEYGPFSARVGEDFEYANPDEFYDDKCQQKFEKTDVLIVDSATGKIVTSVKAEKVNEVAKEIFKNNPDKSYVLYAPQYELKLAERPIELHPIVLPTEENVEPETKAEKE